LLIVSRVYASFQRNVSERSACRPLAFRRGGDGVPTANGPLRTAITILIVLNVALQVFDGIATYVGWQQFGEANPLLNAGFAYFGAGLTLAVTKIAAILILLWLARAPRPVLVATGLSGTFGAYTMLSLIPWSYLLFT
jgi:hypothetical protein